MLLGRKGDEMIAWIFACFIFAVLIYFLLGIVTKRVALRVSISILLFLALSGSALYIVSRIGDS
jgi:hypothetical protein